MKEVKLGFELAGVSKVICDNFRYSAEKLGIVSSYRPFLFFLANNKDGLSQSDLVKLSHFKAPTVSLTLQKMENDGLIRKEVDVVDQRITRIYLTEEGMKLDEKIKTIHKEVEENLSSLFNDEEKKTFLEYLERIKNNMSEGGNKNENI